MRTANPALNEKTFEQFDVYEPARSMTVEGTATKTGMLLVLVVVAAAFTWNLFETAGAQAAMPWMMGGLFGGLILAFATIFKPTWAAVTAPMYGVAEGLFLGGLSAIVQSRFPQVPIVFQAVCLTFGTLFALLIAYRAGVIRATEKFKAGVFAATGGICLLYIATFVLSFFGVSIPYIHGSGPIGIGFSVVVVIIAALNLVLDFDFIEQGAVHGAPKYMEWYGAFGLLVTLVWLYIEILRLLSKLNSRR
jgi:uncharacterized YccA/Bax inhibitor family protein